MVDPRFDEQQVAEILRRSAELQMAADPESESPGLTLTELRRVAAEVGLEPALVERAAQEVVLRASQAQASREGYSLSFDQTMPAVLTDETWEDIVAEMRRFSGRSGRHSVRGTTREWLCGMDAATAALTATKRGDSIRLRLLLDMSGGKVLKWVFGPTFGMFFGLMTGALLGKQFTSPVYAVLIGLAVATAIVAGTQVSVHRWMGKTRERAAKAFESISKILATEQPEEAQTIQPGSEEAPNSIQARG